MPFDAYDMVDLEFGLRVKRDCLLRLTIVFFPLLFDAFMWIEIETNEQMQQWEDATPKREKPSERNTYKKKPWQMFPLGHDASYARILSKKPVRARFR